MSTTKEDFKKSFQDFKALLTTGYDLENYPPAKAEGKTFGTEFPGALIHKSFYKDCKFNGSKFESSDGAFSKFHDCSFDDCFFDNWDLRYCDINKSSFQKTTISGCGFSFGNFIDTHFTGIPFSSCSFRQMQLENTSLEQCTISGSSFEQSDIKHCVLKDLDLRFVGVRYCDFEGTTFENVVFHILDLPRNYGLVEQLHKSSKPVYVAYKNDKLMPLEEAVDYLKKLIPYYLETHQFYELLTTYALHKEYDKIREVLPTVIETLITSCDFSTLQDICTLIVKIGFCSDEESSKLNSQIQELIVTDKFPHYLKKSYQHYITNIKSILKSSRL